MNLQDFLTHAKEEIDAFALCFEASNQHASDIHLPVDRWHGYLAEFQEGVANSFTVRPETAVEMCRNGLSDAINAADLLARREQAKGNSNGAEAFNRIASDLARLANEVMRFEMRGEVNEQHVAAIARELVNVMANAG